MRCSVRISFSEVYICCSFILHVSDVSHPLFLLYSLCRHFTPSVPFVPLFVKEVLYPLSIYFSLPEVRCSDMHAPLLEISHRLFLNTPHRTPTDAALDGGRVPGQLPARALPGDHVQAGRLAGGTFLAEMGRLTDGTPHVSAGGSQSGLCHYAFVKRGFLHASGRIHGDDDPWDAVGALGTHIRDLAGALGCRQGARRAYPWRLTKVLHAFRAWYDCTLRTASGRLPQLLYSAVSWRCAFTHGWILCFRWNGSRTLANIAHALPGRSGSCSKTWLVEAIVVWLESLVWTTWYHLNLHDVTMFQLLHVMASSLPVYEWHDDSVYDPDYYNNSQDTNDSYGPNRKSGRNLFGHHIVAVSVRSPSLRVPCQLQVGRGRTSLQLAFVVPETEDVTSGSAGLRLAFVQADGKRRLRLLTVGIETASCVGCVDKLGWAFYETEKRSSWYHLRFL